MQFFQNFQWWKVVYSGISKGNAANLKIPVFFKKVHPKPSLFGFFSGTVQLQKHSPRAWGARFSELPWNEFIILYDFSLQKDKLFLRFLIFSYHHQLMVVTFPYNHTFQLILMDIIKLTGCPLILTYILQKYSQKHKSRMQMFCVSLFYFLADSKLQNCHDKV